MQARSFKIKSSKRLSKPHLYGVAHAVCEAAVHGGREEMPVARRHEHRERDDDPRRLRHVPPAIAYEALRRHLHQDQRPLRRAQANRKLHG